MDNNEKEKIDFNSLIEKHTNFSKDTNVLDTDVVLDIAKGIIKEYHEALEGLSK